MGDSTTGNGRWKNVSSMGGRDRLRVDSVRPGIRPGPTPRKVARRTVLDRVGGYQIEKNEHRMMAVSEGRREKMNKERLTCLASFERLFTLSPDVIRTISLLRRQIPINDPQLYVNGIHLLR